MNPRLALAASVAGAVVVALDGTVLTVAQPALQRDLDASYAAVQWTSTGYLIAVAGLLVFAGRLADRYGHRWLFGIGLLGFGAVSAGIAVAPGVGWVIGLRVVQGVCGALLQPATLGMLRAAYPPEGLRTPLAVRTAAIGLAAAAGPVVGGALVTGAGWRAVFLLNVVPAAVFGVLALARRAEPRRPEGRHQAGAPALDLPGALLLAALLTCLVHTLVALPASGWTPARLCGLAAAAGCAVALVRHERRTPGPLLPAAVVGAPAVASALGILVAASAALHGTLFACVYLLQRGLGLDALHCALLSLPLAVLMIAAAPCCAVLLRRAGARRTTVTAMAVLALGVLVLDRAAGALGFGAGFALLGAGFGTVMVAATHVVVREAEASSAGVAGGLQQTALNVGPVLGVALAATLTDAGGARAPLPVLAGVALVGAVAGRWLPGRFSGAGGGHGQERVRARVPARR
ncbi:MULTISPECIES: MFS transporter [Streptomyces]|uniref:MFS transporter n=2 Tax=Streptomyces TaxID=1883 RepID=A0A2U9PBK3_STRAS|nr:MFS transporter [Streptomyces actuosus]AWT46444.1 MFS transporter [Streptomyces actuosus]MBM4823148.1 MFS transporter [Streptomyces actuosus]